MARITQRGDLKILSAPLRDPRHPRLVPSKVWPILEGEPQSSPRRSWRAWRVERRVLDGKFAVDRRKRAGDEVSGVGESGWSELRGGVVLAIEQIVDLHEDL